MRQMTSRQHRVMSWRPLKAGAQAPDDAITEANLVRWVIARETYDPADIKPRFDEIRRTSGDDALGDP